MVANVLDSPNKIFAKLYGKHVRMLLTGQDKSLDCQKIEFASIYLRPISRSPATDYHLPV